MINFRRMEGWNDEASNGVVVISGECSVNPPCSRGSASSCRMMQRFWRHVQGHANPDQRSADWMHKVCRTFLIR